VSQSADPLARARKSRRISILLLALAAVPWAQAVMAQSEPVQRPAVTGAPAGQSDQPGVGQVQANSPAEAPAAQGEDTTGFWNRDTLTGTWGGLRSRLEDQGVKFGIQEQSEVWGNLAGGIRTGTVYDGLTTLSLTLDLNKMADWTGGTFFASAYQIHGRGPSANLAGNLQTISNIEALRGSLLFDLWFEQSLLDNRLLIRVGQEGANEEMMLTQYGALFLNSSFGYPALTAFVLPSGGPNYPIAAPMVRIKYKADDQLTFVAAVFNSDPAGPGSGPPQNRDLSGTAFRLSDAALAFMEAWYSINQNAESGGLPGTYKLGTWVTSASATDTAYATLCQSLPISQGPGGACRSPSTHGFYGVADQMIWRRPGSKDQGIGIFGLVMGAPDDRNLVNLYVEGGLNFKGPFEGRDADVFGIGVAYAQLSHSAQRLGSAAGQQYRNNETVLEATYLYQVAPWWTIQPDLQYVINPGAGITATGNGPSRASLKNSVTIGVHAAFTL
jgi:porin